MTKTLGALVLFLPAMSFASTTYYNGTARITDLATGAQSQETVYLMRDVDPDQTRIIETACAKAAGQPMRKSLVTMAVSGDTMKIAGDHLTGTGTLIGPAWAWTTLIFSLDYGNAIHIEDRNYIAGSTLIARKEIAVAGRPVQLWEAELVQEDMPFSC